VLQRMLTVHPWRSFPLRVTLFSDDAQAWWDAARVQGGEKPRVLKRKVSNPKLTIMDLGLGLPDVSAVEVRLRREGVDGKRRTREGEEVADGEAIEVDDWDWVGPYWRKWREFAALEVRADCTVCGKDVDLEVRALSMTRIIERRSDRTTRASPSATQPPTAPPSRTSPASLPNSHPPPSSPTPAAAPPAPHPRPGPTSSKAATGASMSRAASTSAG
jgi:hypothetical protein